MNLTEEEKEVMLDAILAMQSSIHIQLECLQDIAETLKRENKEEEEKPRTFKMGDKFKNKVDGCIYILAQPEKFKICLISFDDGNRWEEPVKVDTLKCITEEEFEEITGEQSENFTLIEEKE